MSWKDNLEGLGIFAMLGFYLLYIVAWLLLPFSVFFIAVHFIRKWW